MDVVEIARAMYEAPAPDETEGAVWPPGHPVDVAWWMLRAAAVMPLVRRAQAEAFDEGFDAHEADWVHHSESGWGDEDCLDVTCNPYTEQGVEHD